ncbi:DUF2339 domain-containing protein [Tsuneonella sp. HG249]
MGFFGFLILAVFTALLWRRTDGLQRELAELRKQLASRPSMPLSAEPVAIASPRAAQQQQVLPTAVVEPEAVVEAATEISEPATEVAAAPAGARFDFEDLFGRLLPIWAGGVTLAVAGFFLVRWSIDAGLLTPAVRVALAGLFGVALLVGAELAYRWRDRVADPRVAQALAGAGLATLYAAFYLAGTGYGLIGSTLAFLGLAGVTAAAIALSFRFGLPSAVLGLVGGFAAPALVGSEQANLPLLTLYLALVTVGLAYTGRRQDRAWLGVAAIAGGLGWGALLLVGAASRTPDAVVLGVYLVLLGAVVPAFAGGVGRMHWSVRVGAAAVAALQVAVLVQQGGFGALQWGLYLMLAAALGWFGWREPAMREANAAGAAIGIALLPFWPDPAPLGFAAVAAGLAAIFAGVPLAQLARGHGRTLDIAQAIGVALGLALATLGHFGSPLSNEPAPWLAFALAALACLPGAVVALSRAQPHGPWQIGAQATAALIAFGAVAQLLPEDALAWIAAVSAAAIAWRARDLIGALAMLASLAALWSLVPVSAWLDAGVLALAGMPMTLGDLPPLREVALRLLPSVVAVAALWTVSAKSGVQRALEVIGIGLAVIAAHTLFRHAFGAAAGSDFTNTGVIQRATWEALLLGTAWLAWTRERRHLAIALAAAGLAHFVWFALVLHNPLWSEQAVGEVPIANALLPMYGLGLAALLLLRGWSPPSPPYLRWALDAGAMVLAALFALSGLRHAYSGSLLTSVTMSPGENLLRSFLGIVLAMGFLWWGARSDERSWRIGSLVVMLVAVLKVFLVDAAGLAGLARIASFMALGFSLIGIGWFYTRQLRRPAAAAPGQPS